MKSLFEKCLLYLGITCLEGVGGISACLVGLGHHIWLKAATKCTFYRGEGGGMKKLFAQKHGALFKKGLPIMPKQDVV